MGVEFRKYEVGEHVYCDETLYQIVKAARTRWGSPTYLARELGTEDKKRWLTPKRETGGKLGVVDRAAIRSFVEAFYGAVDRDPLLGPVFERRIHGEWGPHLDTMVKFWSAVLLREMGYQGQPPVVHRAVGELSPAHFARWLELFGEIVRELFEPELAEYLSARAHGIAEMLSAATLGRPWNAA